MSKTPVFLVGILTCLSWSVGCGETELDPNLPPELPALADAPCELTSQTYRIDAIELPATAQAALAVSLDLDGEESGRPDNAAAQVYSLIASQYDGRLEQLEGNIGAALADGRVRWILEVQTCADGDDYARVGLHRASDLDGDGALRVLPYGYLPAVGRDDGNRILADEGTAAAPVSTLFDVLGTDETPTWVDGYAFTVVIDRQLDGGAIGGRFGLGLDERAFGVAAVPMAAFYTELLELGDSELALDVDADSNGVITPAEVMADPFMAALGSPDIDLVAPFEGTDVYWPLRDGIDDSISFGVGFTAVPVELE